MVTDVHRRHCGQLPSISSSQGPPRPSAAAPYPTSVLHPCPAPRGRDLHPVSIDVSLCPSSCPRGRESLSVPLRGCGWPSVASCPKHAVSEFLCGAECSVLFHFCWRNHTPWCLWGERRVSNGDSQALWLPGCSRPPFVKLWLCVS